MKRIGFALMAAVAALGGCVGSPGGDTGGEKAAERDYWRLPDTLRVGTLYSPTSFFIYRGDSLGIDYDMVRSLARQLRRPMTLTVGRSMGRLVAMLDSGKIDLIAADVPVTAEYAGRIL
ncbi:MAG: transporter substrate-binding domain-containing protein, partial [Muribaculaceae bacterium]|nr:transporter substrate-binding domain-containing protein [Muribaculaceae bacterium]